MPFKLGSLRAGLARRLLVALAIALAVAATGIAMASRLIYEAVSAQQLDAATDHFRARVKRMEENWLVQSESFRAQLAASRVLEESDPLQLQARLTAFATVQGGESTFTHFVLEESGGRILSRYRTRSQQDLPLPAPNSSVAWVFGSQDQTLYRAISQSINWAGGRGRLVLYAPLDNALMGSNVYPGTSLRLLWQGKEVAEARSSAGPTEQPASETAARLVDWEASGPQVQIERAVAMPLGTWQVFQIVLLALIAIGILVWLSLGRWLARQSRRIEALENGATAFLTRRDLSGPVMDQLALAEGGSKDEIARLTASAREGMQDMLRQGQQLKDDEQRFRDMAEMSSDWFWEQDAEFRFTYMSDELLAIFGVKTSSSLGKTRWDLPVQGVSEEAWAAHRDKLSRHAAFRGFEYQIANDFGELRWSSTSGKPVFDAQGQFTGYRGTGRDITQRKRLELTMQDQERRLRALLELSSDWYWEQDAEHRVIRREGAILQRNGSPVDLQIGKRLWESDYINLSEADWNAHRAQLDQREEFRDLLLARVASDGRTLWGRLSGRPRFDAAGHFIGYHGVGRGVTAEIEAEQERAQRDAEIRLLIENVPVSIGNMDRNLVFRYINQGLEGIFRRSREQIVGYHLREMLGEQAFEELEHHFIDALSGKAARYRRTNGQAGNLLQTLEVNVLPQFDAAGRVIGCYDIALDVTASEQVEEEVRSLQTLFTSTFQNTSDLMAIYRVEGEQLIIEGFNRALIRFYEARYEGVTVSDWMGQPIDAFLREVSGLNESDTHVRLARFWEAAHSGNTVQYQTDLPTPQGMQRRSTLLIPILNAKEEVSHLFYRGTDITDLLRKEQELQAVNAGLERKVEERTVALVAANRELEVFAYSVSHDLRTPLRGIDGYSKVLGDEFEAQLGPTGSAYLTRIRKGIQRMGTLIDDLLQLSRVTRAAVSQSLVDVSAMATEVAQEIAEQTPARQVLWQIAPDIKIAADPGLMRLLLENLLGNAFKYSRDKLISEISLTAGGTVKGTEFVIRDNGIGFDMAYAAKLFQPFQRLHSPRQFEGTGIGLATVSRIMARHGGIIEGRGEPGKGAEFRLVFPAPDAEAPQAPPAG